MGKRLGAALRQARKSANFPTIASFAHFLNDQGYDYTDDAVGHWERGRSTPDRDTLLRVLAYLSQRGGITRLETINALLNLADYGLLTNEERQEHFANLGVLITNLPGKDYTQLVGRDDALHTLASKLIAPDALPLVVIAGLGGIGKTALAHEVVYRLLQGGHFTHMVWETAKSEEFTATTIHRRNTSPASLHTILLGYANQLGFTDFPTNPDALQRFLREYLRREKCLLVLDNVETLADARYVARKLYDLIGPENLSRVLITSRERLADEAYVFDYFLRGLTESAALELLALEARQRGAETLLTASKHLLKRIYTVTEGMPLALKLIVSQYQAGIALDTELDRLAGAQDEEELYRFIYHALWQKLSIPAQMVLGGAAAFGTSALRTMLIGVSEVTDSEFQQALSELQLASLIEVLPHPERAKQRYQIHSLTRWFVNSSIAELWEQQQNQDDTTEP